MATCEEVGGGWPLGSAKVRPCLCAMPETKRRQWEGLTCGSHGDMAVLLCLNSHSFKSSHLSHFMYACAPFSRPNMPRVSLATIAQLFHQARFPTLSRGHNSLHFSAGKKLGFPVGTLAQSLRIRHNLLHFSVGALIQSLRIRHNLLHFPVGTVCSTFLLAQHAPLLRSMLHTAVGTTCSTFPVSTACNFSQFGVFCRWRLIWVG